MTERHDAKTESWPARPWIMAAICAVAGFLFDHLVDFNGPSALPAWRQAGATLVAISSLSFVLTVEQRRWTWSAALSAGWGLVIALIGWFTARYNQHPDIFEFPFFSGLFAVLLAAPLFQTVRDEGRWRFPYDKLYWHAWIDAVIGAAGIAFIGVTFLMSFLIAGLFDLIGIHFIKDLLQDSWFAWMLAGTAFGGAVGLLRERDKLVETLQRLVMVVLSVLAPVLAAALLLFLLSLPFTGLGGLWDSQIPATPLMLLAGAGAVLLANAVIGNGDGERTASLLLRRSAQLLVLTVLPLAIIAALSLSQRIGQHGWTPERIWGVVAVLVAMAYGGMGWWAVAKGRDDFDDQLRPLQTRLALGLCGLALVLALPILDFGAISARSQMSRLANGLVTPKDFDWRAMAFDFGPSGRKRLAEIARQGPKDQRALATAALTTTDRYDAGRVVEKQAAAANMDKMLRVVPAGSALPAGLREAIIDNGYCTYAACVALLDGDGRVVMAGKWSGMNQLQSALFVRQQDGRWAPADQARIEAEAKARAAGVEPAADVTQAPVEIRAVERRQLFVDGKPVGQPFE